MEIGQNFKIEVLDIPFCVAKLLVFNNRDKFGILELALALALALDLALRLALRLALALAFRLATVPFL